MVPSGQSTPIGGPQSINPSLLRSNSGMLGGQGIFSSLTSPRTQFSNVNLLGNGGLNPGMPNSVSENDALSSIGNGIGLNPTQSFMSNNPGSSGQVVQGHGQVNSDQHGPTTGLGGQVKMEPRVKMEPLQSEFLQQQQLFQQMSMSRPSSQAAAAFQLNLLQQQRLLQLRQQQQRGQLQEQFPPQNMPIRSPVKPVYESGMCARRITQYMYQQQRRPEDNNIEFWRKFVSDFFAPNAKKKWCVSMYGSGRQTAGVFPQDVWQCEICKHKPGRGFEATVEVLPRLFKIKYESGTLEELLCIDMPREYQNSLGQIVLDYAKAIQESVFEQLRVVRDGQLRIVFSPDLKICSWEFCARRHEELIPRRQFIPQVSQLGTVAQNYQAATQNSSPSASGSDLQSNCNMFVASSRQLAKALDVPLVNDLGYTKRYVRCLQISEVVNSMKDLIDYSRLTGAGPMESLAKFPRRTSAHQPEEQQQPTIQSSNNSDQSPGPMQSGSSNGASSSRNVSSVPTLQRNMSGLLQQNNSRHQNNQNGNSPYSVQMASNNPPSTSFHNGEGGDTNDSQSSSMQKVIQEMMFSQLKNANVNGGPIMGNHNPVGMNGRVARDQSMSHQQQDLGANGFNSSLQFDWKPSP